MNRGAAWVSLAVIVAISLYVFVGDSLKVDQRLSTASTYAALMIALLFALPVLIDIATGKIDISAVLEESGGGASMSRFQLMIFTFVIASCFVLIVIHTQKFPEVRPDILELLGISATTYAVSKGIQAGSDLPSKTADSTSQPKDPAADEQH